MVNGSDSERVEQHLAVFLESYMNLMTEKEKSKRFSSCFEMLCSICSEILSDVYKKLETLEFSINSKRKLNLSDKSENSQRYAV